MFNFNSFQKCACGCGTEFPRTREGRLYFTFNCKKRAERRRIVARDALALAPRVAAAHGWVANPTTEVLNAAAAVLLAQATGSGQTFTGEVPEWQPPAGITWMQDGERWNMVHTGAAGEITAEELLRALKS